MTTTRLPAALLAADDDPATLTAPLPALVAQSDAWLDRTDLLGRAARSRLYAPRWRAAGFAPARAASGANRRQELRQAPFTDGRDLLALAANGRDLAAALLAPPRAWVTSRGVDSAKKWLPLTLGDTARWLGRVRRVARLLALEQDGAANPGLIINEPLPYVSNALPYLWERADALLGGGRGEYIIVSMTMLARNHWDRFAAQKQPQWIAASVADARALGHALDADRKLARLKRGVFWGAPLDGAPAARAELAALFGLSEAFSVYFSAECREMYAECPAHDGLHLWMDGAIHEILPDGATEAQFVDETAAGVEGEYVVTTCDEALPLVRYRTGDRIRVVSTAPCACGITHPRVQFLGRLAGSGDQIR